MQVPDLHVERATRKDPKKRYPDMEARLVYYERHPEEIADRVDELDELDEEWDIERMIEANGSTLAFSGVTLAATVDRRWLALP